ncbi:MAG: transcriptional repressor LexA [Patescibacteria group bacterium]|nr:transcriptional repressor LexA [Patescibacteria group bacterium]
MQEVLPLTQRQKQALDYITKYIQENGYSPALKDVASFLGTENLSTAQYFIEQLTQKGYLKRETYKNRGISPISHNQTVQLLGYIAAGTPIEPIESPITVNLPKDLQLNQKYPHYALKVKGNSMMDMGILDGDTVLVRHQLVAKNGDVIVAITEDGATLKVFREDGPSIYLEAKNKDFPNIYPKSLEIRGKFVGLIRNG